MRSAPPTRPKDARRDDRAHTSALSHDTIPGQRIADTLEAMLQPHGAAVYLEARHLCTQMRGVRELQPLTRTTFWRGVYASNPDLRPESFEICGIHQ